MFEILDKLMVSFGQDTLDSLYYSVSVRKTKKRYLPPSLPPSLSLPSCLLSSLALS
jgi:hypothetical protein